MVRIEPAILGMTAGSRTAGSDLCVGESFGHVCAGSAHRIVVRFGEIGSEVLEECTAVEYGNRGDDD